MTSLSLPKFPQELLDSYKLRHFSIYFQFCPSTCRCIIHIIPMPCHVPLLTCDIPQRMCPTPPINKLCNPPPPLVRRISLLLCHTSCIPLLMCRSPLLIGHLAILRSHIYLLIPHILIFVIMVYYVPGPVSFIPP